MRKNTNGLAGEEVPKETNNEALKSEVLQKSGWLRKGITVDALELKSIDDNSSLFVELKLKMINDINGVPLFTDITLRLTKQALSKIAQDGLRILKIDAETQ